MARKSLSIKNINKVPKKSGVYFLKNKAGEIFYIGKAVNLRSRIKTHANKSLSHIANRPLRRHESKAGQSHSKASRSYKIYKVEYIVTANEIEALLKESVYIKKYTPKMNYRLRDDKKYFYVGISNEDLPRVFITHQPTAKGGNVKGQISNIKGGTKYLGPYTDGAALKQTMKYLRKIFPYYMTSPKRPLSSPKHRQLACSWCHLDLCPGPAPNRMEYKKNIRRLKNILRGQQKSVITSLKKEMKTASQKQNYEKAQKLKNITKALENIFLHHNITPQLVHTGQTHVDYNTASKYLSKLLKTDLPIMTIEGYDVSNIQGREPTASMVRFYEGKPDKSMYRKFNIHSLASPDDYRMISEALQRRLKHTQWAYPDMILIDGGRGQLNTALKILKKLELTIPVSSLAKREEELYLPNRKPIPLKTMPRNVENLLKHIRDEAHRFAISHHRMRHRKTFEK